MEKIIKKAVIDNREEVISKISELVQIPSVRNLEDKAEGAPFGKDIGKALDYVIDLGNKLGMRTFRDKSGYYGYIEVGDVNLVEMVGIIGHLDVVPAGDVKQWNTGNPFSGEVVDDVLYGRGSLDDKGPIVMALYSLKILMDLNFEFKKRVRIILGTAEETTWEGMNEYIKKEEHPTIAFSPDAEFPGIYAEKAIIQADVTCAENVDFEIEALGAYNAVCDLVSYTGSKKEQLKEELDRLGYSYKEEDSKVLVTGKSAHAMSPESGVNAIYLISEALFNIGENSKVIDFIAKNVAKTYFGEKIVGEVEDEISGKLKFTVGRIKVGKEEGYFSIDSRIPVLVDDVQIEEKYKSFLKERGLEFNLLKKQEKLYVEQDSFLVSTLLDVYAKVMGEKNPKPLAIGGGTYARAFDNCIAYGALFQDRGQIDNMHQPNECLELKFLNPALEIYANAIYELAKK